MQNMNTLDIVFLAVVFISILFGVLKGFIKEVLSLVFMALAVVLGFLFYSEAGAFLRKYIDDRNVANFAGFIAVFVIVLIIGAIMTYIIKGVLTVGPLKAVDRIMGGVFGLLRGVLLCGIIVFALVVFPVNDKLITRSRLSPYVVSTIQVFIKLLPGDVQKKVNLFKKRSSNRSTQAKGKAVKTVPAKPPAKPPVKKSKNTAGEKAAGKNDRNTA